MGLKLLWKKLISTDRKHWTMMMIHIIQSQKSLLSYKNYSLGIKKQSLIHTQTIELPILYMLPSVFGLFLSMKIACLCVETAMV